MVQTTFDEPPKEPYYRVKLMRKKDEGPAAMLSSLAPWKHGSNVPSLSMAEEEAKHLLDWLRSRRQHNIWVDIDEIDPETGEDTGRIRRMQA